MMNHTSIFGRLPTVIRRIDYPMHKGQPNPSHGKYHFVGSVPVAFSDTRFDTEQDAITAAISAGCTRIQRWDCSFVDVSQPSIPTLEPVRDQEIAHPQFALPESDFTLTAPAETDATQTSLF